MRFLFFQNCISPHQMPYIEALSEDRSVEEVWVIAPRITYGHRADLGWPESWTQSVGKLHILLSPVDQEVKTLIADSIAKAEERGEMVIANFSGISAFPEIKRWLDISLSFKKLLRGIITEAPFAKGKKYLLWLHRLHFLLTDYRYIRHIQYVFAIGEDCVSYYRGWSSHWRVIPFLYCTQTPSEVVSSELQDAGDKKLRILFVGALEQRKNVSFLFDALKDSGVDYSLSIVGDGNLRADLERQAVEKGIQVNFFGTCPNAEIPRIMKTHDLLVLPSLHDGWGAVINEAASVGTLTACSSQCGARSIANYVFDLEQQNGLRQIIHKVAADIVALRLQRTDRMEWANREISPFAVSKKMLDGIVATVGKC